MIDPNKYGVSFSLKQCGNFGINPDDCLSWLIDEGWRRFRVMSYWDIHEPREGRTDFAALDRQLELITEAGGVVTLCLGVKQPRWPEYHWPDWAWRKSKSARDVALLAYVRKVVERYRDNPCIVSWQLENEALLSNFGRRIEIDRDRLRAEFELVRELDPARPIIMSASNGWGIPLRRPRPDIVGFSYYPIMHQRGKYRRTVQKPWFERLRCHLVHQKVFIHELQCEPWGPQPIWQMDAAEQAKSMSNKQLETNLRNARKIGVYPIDLWGAEWWYWRQNKHQDSSIWKAVKSSVST